MDTDILIELLIQFYIMCTTVQLISLVYYYIARYQENVITIVVMKIINSVHYYIMLFFLEN